MPVLIASMSDAFIASISEAGISSALVLSELTKDMSLSGSEASPGKLSRRLYCPLENYHTKNKHWHLRKDFDKNLFHKLSLPDTFDVAVRRCPVICIYRKFIDDLGHKGFPISAQIHFKSNDKDRKTEIT